MQTRCPRRPDGVRCSHSDTYETHTELTGLRAMTLLWTDAALDVFQRILAGPLPSAVTDRLVRAVVLLERDASTFIAANDPLVIDTAPLERSGPLWSYVLEADPGRVFVLYFRLATDAEDVWLLGLEHTE